MNQFEQKLKKWIFQNFHFEFSWRSLTCVFIIFNVFNLEFLISEMSLLKEESQLNYRKTALRRRYLNISETNGKIVVDAGEKVLKFKFRPRINVSRNHFRLRNKTNVPVRCDLRNSCPLLKPAYDNCLLMPEEHTSWQLMLLNPEAVSHEWKNDLVVRISKVKECQCSTEEENWIHDKHEGEGDLQEAYLEFKINCNITKKRVVEERKRAFKDATSGRLYRAPRFSRRFQPYSFVPIKLAKNRLKRLNKLGERIKLSEESSNFWFLSALVGVSSIAFGVLLLLSDKIISI